MKLRSLALACVVFVAGCAHAPRPLVLGDVDSVRSSPAARDAAQSAPQAHARAERFRQDAERAYQQGDILGARFLAEQALAAYEHATILARLARAQSRRAEAEQQLQDANQELDRLRGQQRKLETEARDLEMRARVVQDLEPLRPSEPSSPERERARRMAARTLAYQARLLCVSAGLLDPSDPGLLAVRRQLEEFEAAARTDSAARLIDESRRLRSACLRALGVVRRKALADVPSPTALDSLLTELSTAGHFAFRDDRGVVVVLRDIAASGVGDPSLQATMSQLAAVAKGHPSFPVLVVVNSPRAEGSPNVGSAIQEALTRGGAPRVTIEEVRGLQPAIGAHSHRTGQKIRVEVVFVAPTAR